MKSANRFVVFLLLREGVEEPWIVVDRIRRMVVAQLESREYAEKTADELNSAPRQVVVKSKSELRMEALDKVLGG